MTVVAISGFSSSEDLDVIRVKVEKIRENVAYWSTTPSRVNKIEDVACQLRLSCNRKLSLNYKTRSNSTYLVQMKLYAQWHQV